MKIRHVNGLSFIASITILGSGHTMAQQTTRDLEIRSQYRTDVIIVYRHESDGLPALFKTKSSFLNEHDFLQTYVIREMDFKIYKLSESSGIFRVRFGHNPTARYTIFYSCGGVFDLDRFKYLEAANHPHLNSVRILPLGDPCAA